MSLEYFTRAWYAKNLIVNKEFMSILFNNIPWHDGYNSDFIQPLD